MGRSVYHQIDFEPILRSLHNGLQDFYRPAFSLSSDQLLLKYCVTFPTTTDTNYQATDI